MILTNLRRIIMTACCGIILWGCNQEENIIPESSGIPIAFNATNNWVLSRLITDPNNENKSIFTFGDKIGVFCYYNAKGVQTAGLPNYMYNQEVTLNQNGDHWDYDPVRFWPADPTDRLKFIAYYPYNDAQITVGKDETAGIVSFAVNPTYKTDLLIAETENRSKEEKTELKFKHLLAKVKINIKHLSPNLPITPGVNELYIKSIKFNNYPIAKTLKLTSGKLTEEITTQEYFLLTESNFSEVVTEDSRLVLERYVLAGQLNSLSIRLASGNINEPEITLPINIDIEGGQIVTLNISVSVTEFGVSVSETWWDKEVDSNLTI